LNVFQISSGKISDFHALSKGFSTISLKFQVKTFPRNKKLQENSGKIGLK